MKISTKGIYGVKAMIDLAYYSSSDIVRIRDISKRQDISERYLEQIFSLLRKSGLIEGKKGSGGGYVLTKNPKEITMGEILVVLEGKLKVINSDDYCKDDLERCINENLWEKINESIGKVVYNITLEELLEKYKDGRQSDFMYYI